MAYTEDKGIGGLETLSTLADGDLIVVGDITDSNRAKAITKADVLTSPALTGNPTAPTQSANDNSTKIATTAYADSAGVSAVTLVPQSAIYNYNSPDARNIATKTTAHLGQIILPLNITVNKISIRTTSTVNTAGTYILSIFSEDGQTRHISVTTASISAANTIYTTAVSAVSLLAGVYYLCFQPVDTADANFYAWNNSEVPFSTTAGMQSDVSSEPVLAGTITVTADTAPSTITPTSITESASSETLIIRLDN